ncbi:MAG: GIY-YIG nuclease family protein [Candidatus Kaiserbacteria bacterium]|nr:GIY-YIG nuclease family protein [Candidatus Kaiserbacteria bacterium]
MDRKDVDFTAFSDGPGAYLFLDAEDTILYVGRATNLQDRIRSYFSERLGADRGQRMVDALLKTERIETKETDSVLEAYILEAHLIKKHEPAYNVVDKDNKSFQYVGITDEEFPRVLVVRGRDLERGVPGTSFRYTYGPFPRGSILKEALRVIRKLLPFRDTCTPAAAGRTRPCFRAQIGLCPGVCSGEVDAEQYKKRIREIRMVFEGKKKQLITLLEREMRDHVQEQEFEEAEVLRRRILSLTHIQDVHLIKRDELVDESDTAFRVEAYDIAHLGGKQAIGVMVAFINGERSFTDYRTFTIHSVPGDDIAGLREILTRRLGHAEWRLPQLIVVDGGKAHLRAAERILSDYGLSIPIVSVVKDERHKPREVLGDASLASEHERVIITSNTEAHRFAMSRHRKKRSQSFLS